MQCKHCGQKSNDSLLLKCEEYFCCYGCKAAYTIIKSLDLEKYYEYCATIYGKTPMKIHEVQNELSYVEHIIPLSLPDTSSPSRKEQRQGQGVSPTTAAQHYRINLIVEGIHCGSCVWLIENTLRKQAGVLMARLNLTTRRLVLEWEGEAADVNNLIRTIEKLGYKLTPFTPDASIEENRNKEHELLKCMFVAGFGSVAIMMITFGVWVANANHEITQYFRDMLHWCATLITVPIVLYSGRPFFRSALRAVKARRSSMDIPISLATILTMLISMQELMRSSEYIYLDAAVSLVFFLLIGRYIDLKMRNRAREYAQNMILSQAQSVTLDCEGVLKLTDIKNACEGDIAFIAAGERIPVDGVVIDGESAADNSLITGETLPMVIKKGSAVYSGTVNLYSPIRVKITKVGDNTILAEIIRLMEVAEQSKAKFVSLADKVAGMYTPAVLSLSTLTLLGWLLAGVSMADALVYAVSVMIITCPCALGLAVPVVQVVATGRLLSKGIIVKTENAFEKLSQADYLVFDKTGTLTEGKPRFINPGDFSKGQLEILTALAAQSRHPLSQAIVRTCAPKSPSTSSAVAHMHKFQAIEEQGFGIRANVDGKEYRLGNREFCKVPEADVAQLLRDEGYSEAWFVGEGSAPIHLKFKDEIKEDAKILLDWAKSRGYGIELLSGDRGKAVEKAASLLEIQTWFAERTPKQKYLRIEELEQQGKRVLVIGDGLNDSAALKLAHASMSPATALEIAQTSADIVFQGNKLWPIKETLLVAKKTVALVKQNFFIAFAYNIVTIPFAVLGGATPAMAAIIMSTSSILVVANAMRLKA